MLPISKHFRWSLAFRGAAAILFGLLAWSWPGITLLILLALFGAYALVDGIFAMINSLSHRKVAKYWWMVLLGAIASIAVGLITFAWPGITALVLLIFIAARAIVVGIVEFATAIKYRHVIRHEWLLGLAGTISVIFGVFVLANPLRGALAMIWLIATYAFLVGVTELAFAIFASRSEGELPMGQRPSMA